MRSARPNQHYTATTAVNQPATTNAASLTAAAVT